MAADDGRNSATRLGTRSVTVAAPVEPDRRGGRDGPRSQCPGPLLPGDRLGDEVPVALELAERIVGKINEGALLLR